MGALDIKLLRDFRRLWVQAVAIALVMAGGIAIWLMSFGLSDALDETRSAYYERNRFADIFADARRVPQSRLADVLAIEGVATADARNTAMATIDLAGKIDVTLGLFISWPEAGEPALNLPILRSGRWPERGAEVIVNEPFATANNLVIGDRFLASLNGVKRPLTIVGTALSPEYIYAIGPGSLVPDNADFGVVWMPEATLAAAFDRTGAFNNLTLSLTPDARPLAVIDAVDDVLAPYGGIGAIERSDQISHAFIDAEIQQLRTMAFVLPPIFFAITAFLVNTVIGRIVTLERAEIGLLKALGYTNIAISLHYLALAGLIAMVGVALGWAAGSWLSWAMANLYAAFFNFPYLIYNVSWNSYFVSGLLGLLAGSVGAVRASWRAASLSPAVAMTPASPTRFRRNFVDRALANTRLSQPSMMILRSVVRWPLRAAIGALGMGLAVAILTSVNVFPDSIDEIIETAFYQSNRQHVMLFFADDMPESTLQTAQTLPGVLQVEGQQYHSAILRNGHHEKRTAIEARRPGMDLSRIIDASGRIVDAPPGGIMLSNRLADQLDVRVGDLLEVELTSGKRGTYHLPVTGRVTQYFGLGAYMDQATLNALFQQAPRVSTISVTIDTAEYEAFQDALKDLPQLTGSAVLTESRRSFEQTIQENILIMNAIYWVLGVLITVGVAYNGTRIQLSERARELASLRILGFTRNEVAYVLVGETMLLALLAQPLGWVLGWGIAWLLTSAFDSDLYTIPLVLKPKTFALASLVVLTVALASALVVRRRLDGLNLISVMKTRE
jgi:putative ABC transport system permease protein